MIIFKLLDEIFLFLDFQVSGLYNLKNHQKYPKIHQNAHQKSSQKMKNSIKKKIINSWKRYLQNFDKYFKMNIFTWVSIKGMQAKT